jgi:hypothetical protein
MKSGIALFSIGRLENAVAPFGASFANASMALMSTVWPCASIENGRLPFGMLQMANTTYQYLSNSSQPKFATRQEHVKTMHIPPL